MANLKEVRVRIASVQSTQKITSAMKMVSASKLRRAQTAILKLRPYAQKLNQILSNLCSDQSENVFAQSRAPEHVVLVVITSNKGLCGGFNVNVTKETSRLLRNKYAEQVEKGNVSLICIGKKGYEVFKKTKIPILKYYDTLLDAPSFEKVSEIAEFLMDSFKNKTLDKVEIVYNEFKNAANQLLIAENYLPVVTQHETSASKNNTDYIFEPNKAVIFEELIPKILKLQLYKTVLDSLASEHGARMTAMHKATDNAHELIRTLSLAYNKARQAAITNEISEIVSGAEALKA